MNLSQAQALAPQNLYADDLFNAHMQLLGHQIANGAPQSALERLLGVAGGANWGAMSDSAGGSSGLGQWLPDWTDPGWYIKSDTSFRLAPDLMFGRGSRS